MQTFEASAATFAFKERAVLEVAASAFAFKERAVLEVAVEVELAAFALGSHILHPELETTNVIENRKAMYDAAEAAA